MKNGPSHVHVNLIDATIVIAYMVIGTFLIRGVMYAYPDSRPAKALAAIT